MNTSRLVLDHIFVCTDNRGQALQALTAAGLVPGPNRVHPGQGTANDCFYFENAYLESLWMRDESEIRSPAVRPLGLWERIHWRESGACPFGVAFRPESGFDISELESWPYEAAFLPAGASIPIFSPKGAVDEPLLFLPPGAMPPPEYPATRRAPLVHRGKQRRITGAAIELARGGKRAPRLAGGKFPTEVSHAVGSAFHLKLELDGGGSDTSDLRPILPLTIRW